MSTEVLPAPVTAHTSQQNRRDVRVFTSTGSGVIPSSPDESTTVSPAGSTTSTRQSQQRGRRGRGAPQFSRNRTGPVRNGGFNNARTAENDSQAVPIAEPSASQRPRHRSGRDGGRPKIPLSINQPVAIAESSTATNAATSTPESGNGDNTPSKRRRKPRNKKMSAVHNHALGGAEADDLTASLVEGLSSGDYECMICFDSIKQRESVWSCAVCWAVFHLRCVGKWGRKSAQESNASTSASSQAGWRCPGCQSVSIDIPSEYRCFCSKTLNPPYNRYATPHSCGNTCGRNRNCPHACTMPCHPGPCRPCESLAPPVSCHCGKNQFVVRCNELASTTFDKSCGKICKKNLSCGIHKCAEICHPGDCETCPIVVIQTCHCGKSSREMPCGSPSTPYSCGKKCDIEFACGHHTCERYCHDITNHKSVCPYDPKSVTRCPCGARSIEDLTGGRGRKSCSDDIPTCGEICSKVLACGHRCASSCHRGECPPCEEVISMPCRCGKEVLDTPCTKLRRDERGQLQPPLCDRPCQALRQCKRHRCKQQCCDIEYHICEMLCEKTLKCKKHQCQLPCAHPGPCHDCVVGVSFDELACHCGRTIMYPPIPCGTASPICTYPCARSLPCNHQSFSEHNCHPDSEPCPPCVVFVERPCACGKNIMKNIPCSRQGLPSCGEACGSPIPSCGHPCLRFCHTGNCVDVDHKCLAKCGRVRSLCKHICEYNCHGTKYCAEDRPCQAKVTQTCRCGRKKNEVTCGAWKESMGASSTLLSCDDGCALAERNQRLAEALQIEPRSASESATADYADSLLRQAHKNSSWVQNVERTLAGFVNDPSKRVHHFPNAKLSENNFIVNLAAHYNLVGEVIDADRKGQASVVVRKTAAKSGCVPSVTLSTAAATYQQPSVTGSSAGSAKRTIATRASTSERPPINALHLTSLQFGMDSRDLELLLEPIVGSDVTMTTKLLNYNAVVILSGNRRPGSLSGRMGPEDIEALLVAVEPDIRSKFITNNWAKDVKCCWVTAEGEIIIGSKPKAGQAMGSAAAKAAYAASVRQEVPMANAFDVLADAAKAKDVKEKTSQENLSRPVIPRPPTPDSWDNDED